jgi:hypothetical protein
MAKEHFNTLNSLDVNVSQEFDVSRLKYLGLISVRRAFRYAGISFISFKVGAGRGQ